MDINDIKKKITPVLKKYDITKAGIIGSVVRGEMEENSDVDILVEIERDDISLLDLWVLS